jgi:hypothetical protein
MGEAPTLWTVDDLLRLTERVIPLPFLSELKGSACTITIRKVARAEYLAQLPPLPEEAKNWPAKEFDAREIEWLKSLAPEALEARRREMRRAKYQIVADASLEPKLTPEQAERLGDDLDVVAKAVLDFMNEGAPGGAA